MSFHRLCLLSMKFRLTLCVLAASAGVAAAQPASPGTDEIADLKAQVHRLTGDVLQARAELILWKIDVLTAELRQIRSAREILSNERKVVEREIGELTLPSVSGPAGEDEGRKEELNNVQMPALHERERSVSAREDALASSLSVEKARLAELRERIDRWDEANSRHREVNRR